ncbi:peptide chain release factor 2 [Candidatus Falkowbacteria bacterium]|jgi:peptide chain release factor 2|nr:peptide chain release factor 2 [Candidatus Falkowbacteria bacterium]
MQDLINKITHLKDRLNSLWQIAKVDEKRQEIILLQSKMGESGFWSDNDRAKKISQESSHLEFEVEIWDKVKRDLKDLFEITEIDKDDKTVNLRKEIESQLATIEKTMNKLELNVMFSDKYDHSNAIMAIHAGAGGTDAQDWAEMLLRMFLRFAEKNDWQTQIINVSAGSEAGIKSVMFEVKGYNAYGFLKSEAGVHRLVRISPFDAEKMRHTSFALAEVLPHVDEVVDLVIDEKDLRIDTYRSGGHGGQGVNTTDSAVRITHLPTKIVVTCQNERSQQQNKETALKVLKSKLQKYHETEVEEEKQKLRGEFSEAAWGNQVRSYVLHPYKMVKDHRTDFQTDQVDSVLDGNLIEFIEAHLKQVAKG